MAGCFTVFSHVILDHITFQMCLYSPPPSVNIMSVDRAENPKTGPKIFTESDIKIIGTMNMERSTEGASHIFMPNHSQVRQAASNDHAELCTFYPLTSTKAAWQPFFSLPPHKNINQSCSNMMARPAPATEWKFQGLSDFTARGGNAASVNVASVTIRRFCRIWKEQRKIQLDRLFSHHIHFAYCQWSAALHYFLMSYIFFFLKETYSWHCLNSASFTSPR